MKHYRNIIKNALYVKRNKYLLLYTHEISISTRNRMWGFPLLQRTSSSFTLNPTSGFTLGLTWALPSTTSTIVGSLLRGNRRRYSTKLMPISRTHYYDVLGVTPNSTQSEIKNAYYMLSKQHHPDVNKDVKAHGRFSEISEAYEILGNTSKRRLYDHGAGVRRQEQMHTGHGAANYTRPFTEGNRFESERRPPPTGRTPYFNFDEFYRQHYAEVLQKEIYERRLYEEILTARARDAYEQRIRFHLTCFFVFCLMAAYALLNENGEKRDVRKKNS